jgi:hypothetical protein
MMTWNGEELGGGTSFAIMRIVVLPFHNALVSSMKQGKTQAASKCFSSSPIQLAILYVIPKDHEVVKSSQPYPIAPDSSTVL